MKQHDNEESVRTLGIHMLPVFNQDRTFQEVKSKKNNGKLFNALMTAQLTHLHDNSNFMSKVYFGCRIMDVMDAQEM